jgi:phage-related protein
MVSDEDSEISERKPHVWTSLWAFLGFFLLFSCLFFLIDWWQSTILQDLRKNSPFLKVTNREFSLFLGQNPSFLRTFSEYPMGYLPYFSSEDELTVVPEFADDYVSASPEIIFRYHVWNRLIGKSWAPNPIYVDELKDFLKKNVAWLPFYWKNAPTEYLHLVDNLDSMPNENLGYLSEQILPYEVRMAFQGWRNFEYDWREILKVKPTLGKMQEFLQEHTHYNRNYWRNILEESNPNYLRSFPYGEDFIAGAPTAKMDKDELSIFLKIGYYNFLRAKKVNSSSR